MHPPAYLRYPILSDNYHITFTPKTPPTSLICQELRNFPFVLRKTEYHIIPHRAATVRERPLWLRKVLGFVGSSAVGNVVAAHFAFVLTGGMNLRLFLAVFLFSFVSVCGGAELRLGMIGLDTSHVTAFAELLNNPENKKHVPGGKVVAAFKGGSPDIESSASRVEGYTKTLQEKYGVKIVPTIEELCREVDAVLLMSVDGRPHLEQAKPVIAAKKPMFIDKPMAGSLKDVVTIFRLANTAQVPVFSSSSYRFYESLVELKKTDIGEIKGAISYGPCTYEEHHPDLFWYGVHPTEALFTVMGTGLETVTRVATKDTDVVTGVWKDGRVGTLRGLRNASTPHKVILFGTKAISEQKGSGDYAPLVREIITFFETGKTPVSTEETIEMFAFMEAADESKRQDGKPVSIREVLRKASTP